jgi:hypothetical protein
LLCGQPFRYFLSALSRLKYIPSRPRRRGQNLVEERRKLVEEKTAQLIRLIGYLKIYFPQMLE